MEKDQLSFVSPLTVNPFYHPLHTDFESQFGLPVNNSLFFFFFNMLLNLHTENQCKVLILNEECV